MFECMFKRSNQAVTLDCKCFIKVHGNVIQTDPQLLFQRLTLVAKSRDNLEGVFRFEICSFPPALFSGIQFLREANKPVLANAVAFETLFFCHRGGHSDLNILCVL